MSLAPPSSRASSSSAAQPLWKTRSGAYTGPTFAGNYTSAGGNGGQGFAYASAYVVLTAATKDRIGLTVTNGVAATTIRLGIYSDNGDMRPGALLLDAGGIDSTAAAFREIVISQALPADIYWLVALPLGGSPTFQGMAGDGGVGLSSTLPLPGPSAQVAIGPAFGGYVDVGGNVALPNPFPVPTYYQAGPMIVLRDA